MKINYALAAAMALAATHVPAQGPSARPAFQHAGELPIGHDCTITVDPRGEQWLSARPALDPPPGFRPDYTIFGKLVDVGPEWVVVKEGKYTNWIARERVFSIRASY